jgi:putative flippase GtrA
MGYRVDDAQTEFARFIVAGCFNTGLGFLIYCLGILVGLNYVAANAIAWVIGVLVGFVLTSRFVFRKPYGHRRFVLFIASNVLGLIVSTTSLTLLIKLLGVDAIVASIISIPLIVAIGYLTGKFGIFR